MRWKLGFIKFLDRPTVWRTHLLCYTITTAKEYVNANLLSPSYSIISQFLKTFYHLSGQGNFGYAIQLL